MNGKPVKKVFDAEGEVPWPTDASSFMADEVRAQARAAWAKVRSAGWDFAVCVARIDDGQLFRRWGYRSREDWGREEYGMKQAATLCRFVQAGRFALALDVSDEAERVAQVSERGRWLELPIWNAMEALELAKKDEKLAYEIVSSGATQAMIRREVRDAQPEQHYDTEWRRVTALVTEGTMTEVRRALNLLRWEAGEPAPTDDVLFRAWAQHVLQLPLPPEWEAARADIEQGDVRCRMCQSWDVRTLERHHVLPRSHGGHEGPLVYLCQTCHREWQPKWRELAAHLGLLVEATAP